MSTTSRNHCKVTGSSCDWVYNCELCGGDHCADCFRSPDELPAQRESQVQGEAEDPEGERGPTGHE